MPELPRAAVFASVCLAALLPPPASAGAQDSNILYPVDRLERMLRTEPFEVASIRGTRVEGDRTRIAALRFGEGTVMNTKWAAAPPGGETFNNVPRYELAAYELQKLFLDESGYVVPPTVARCFPLDWFRALEPGAEPSFEGTGSVLVVIQYWLWNVRAVDVWDATRFREDPAYARHVANLNVLTYLIRHSDSNLGNFLLSEDPENPRIFAVDNGVAFQSEAGDRGTAWRKLRVDRIPRATAERLRAIGPDDLGRTLGTLLQLEVGEDGVLVPVERGPPLGGGRQGIRRKGNVFQLGLSASELEGVRARLERLVRHLDEGRIGVF